MRTSSLTVIAAAVLAGGSFGLLAGCSAASTDDAVVPPVLTQTTPAEPTERALRPSTSVDRAPLGLEVRYIGADGTFTTLAPEDFQR
ncbi:MAG TPA: hypothetical protein VIT41_04195 [Microlunatus sp.]|jgi:hypothetical protein